MFQNNTLLILVFSSSGLNFQDLMIRLGAIDPPPKTPTILGFECAGEVEAIGEGVEDFAVSLHNNTHMLFHEILIIKCFDIFF